MKTHVAIAIGSLMAMTLVQGCRSKTEAEAQTDNSDVLISVGDSALLMRDVLRNIPAGMDSEDSVALFNAVVDGWLERMLLEDFAKENVEDLERIEKLTADYRKKLIIASYRRQLREAGTSEVAEERVKEYFKSHRGEMVLERPVVKGLYVKLPSDSKRIGDVRRWIMTATPDALDNLERYGLVEAAEYSFFEDSWTDWELLARQIPYRFGNADEFVAKSMNFETSYRGMTYLLHIKEYIHSGERMPYEVAAPMIRERLESLGGEEYERKLMESLYGKARKEGKLQFVNYDPLNHKLIQKVESAGE